MFKYLTFTEEVLLNQIMKFPLFALRVGGQIVSSMDCAKVYHFFRAFFCFAAIFYVWTADVVAICLERTDVGKGILLTASFILFVTIFLRMFLFFVHRRAFFELITEMHEGINKLLAERRDYITELYGTYTKRMNSINMVLVVAIGVSSASNIYGAVYFLIFDFRDVRSEDTLNLNWTLPPIYEMFPTWTLSDNFLLAYIFPIYIEFIGGFGLVVWTCFNIGLMQYPAFCLDVLNYKLEHLTDYYETDREADISTYAVHRSTRIHLIECANLLAGVKNFAKKYEGVTKYNVFVESATSTAMLCAIMFQIARSPSSTFFVYLPWVMATLFVLFLYYWNANEILCKSGETCRSVYQSSWYELPNYLQKDVLLLMRGYMEPLVINAILFDMNTSSFVAIVKTSYSYFTLLTNLDDRHKP